MAAGPHPAQPRQDQSVERIRQRSARDPRSRSWGLFCLGRSPLTASRIARPHCAWCAPWFLRVRRGTAPSAGQQPRLFAPEGPKLRRSPSFLAAAPFLLLAAVQPCPSSPPPGLHFSVRYDPRCRSGVCPVRPPASRSFARPCAPARADSAAPRRARASFRCRHCPRRLLGFLG